MPRPQFADMLVNRRRQLGLSITQASQVLRLKEQVLVAFEEGDFERIPKSGYAQGMLSSYARYLGLNSRDVVRQFSIDLDRYMEMNPGIDQNGASYGGGTGDVTRRQVATFGTAPYVGTPGLLPTSGGLAGDMGAFATTSQPHSRYENSYSYESDERAGQSQGYNDNARDTYRYTSRQPATGRPAQSSRSFSRYGDARYLDTGQGYGGDAYGRDQVTTRQVSQSQYVDDLRYDDGARPYQAASTSTGRRSSRNIASTQRPSGGSARSRQRSERSRNRSRSSQGRSQGQQVRRDGRSGGIVGGVMDFFSDPARIVIAVGLVVAIILTLIIILSVQSCVKGRAGDSEKQTVSVTQTNTTTTSATGQNTTATSATTSADTAGSTSATSATTTTSTTSATNATTSSTTARTGTTDKTNAKETKVVVSVEAGAVSWVDVQVDGESMVADTITGPWSETYEVHDSIIIEVGDTTAVTVTENGSRRQFDQKTSGIGSITIQGTPEKTDSSSSKTDDSKKTDGDEKKTDATSDSDSSKKTDEEKSDDNTLDFDESKDEYLYDMNGYSIYYNEKNKLYYFYDESGVRRDASNGQPV